MSVFQFFRSQRIPATLDDVWTFISSPKNLKEITPDDMGFDITTPHLEEGMYPGMIITYRVRPIAGIEMTWVTEITHVREKVYFVDEQRHGPYRMWHHEHWIKPVPNGVLMEDLITYEPPLGWMGNWMNSLFIRKRITAIFDYRKQALEKRFDTAH